MAKTQEPELNKTADANFDIQVEFEKMSAQFSKLLDALKDKGETKVSELQGKLVDEFADYKDVASEKVRKAQAVGSEGVEQVEGYIRKNPLTSLAIAFGVGFILSKILSK